MIDKDQIEFLLNGERAEADVLNRPLRQVVNATNESFSDVNDAIDDINTSIDDTVQLIEERYDDIFEVIKDGNGWTRERDARLIFDSENATVSIAPGLGKSSWFYYHKGRKIESSETLTYTLSEAEKTGGGFYLSFDKDKNFVNTGEHPDFFNTTLCFYVHYSNGEFIIEGDERHIADRDTAWHESHHREDGMTVYTLGNIDWTPDDANNVGIQLTTTLVSDEDLQHLITHSPTGEEPFSQILEGSQDTVRIPTLYYDGSIRYLPNKKLPWVVDALKYNDGTTLKDVPNGKFVNYFLVATNCQKYPIKLIMGREIFDTDDETVDETLEALGLNFPEMALLYRISIERDDSLSTVGKCKLKSVQQAASRITFESSAASSGTSLSNHAQLLGRTEDNAHPISAITGLQEALSDIDSSTTDALATKADKSANLSDLTSASAARNNLGLGTAATRDVGTGDGNLMEVGAFGVGSVFGHNTYRQLSGDSLNIDEGFEEKTKLTETTSFFRTEEASVQNGKTIPKFVPGIHISSASLWGRLYFSEYGEFVFQSGRWGTRKNTEYVIHTGNILSGTGQSTQYPMTQKAVTDALNTKAPSSHTHAVSQITGLQDALSDINSWVKESGQITVTGSATLNGTTNNTVRLTNIVSTLALEVGDVIRIQYSGYDKLHTVESITDNNSIIVNYEHAGNRGDGSLKLPDFTGTATVTRIAKWFNAPLGLGQAWVDVLAGKAYGVSYTNSTGRTVCAAINKSQPVAQYSYFYVDDSLVLRFTNLQQTQPMLIVITPGSTYRLESTASVFAESWMELR